MWYPECISLGVQGIPIPNPNLLMLDKGYGI